MKYKEDTEKGCFRNVSIIRFRRKRNIALLWFVLVFILSLLQQIYASVSLFFIIPVVLIAVPSYYLRPLPLGISFSELLLGVVWCALLVLPFILIKFFVMEGTFHYSNHSINILLQLLLNAFAEELFFRGYLQESLGNRPSTVVIVSVLFALCHSGRFLVSGDIMALLTFFPSLIMGWLYHKTSNVLPGTIFHFTANMTL
ncbi:MAG: CPBP family intramembrane metalloprotease [Nitrospirae bacterium]|nr:CPBP family intramembrane metalloprotease [Nitrospirota bacterium]